MEIDEVRNRVKMFREPGMMHITFFQIKDESSSQNISYEHITNLDFLQVTTA